MTMTMAMTFSCLRPNVTKDEAIDAFQHGPGNFLARLRGGRGRGVLRSVADVYVPYHLFRVEITNGRRHQTARFAIDAVRGMLDLYRFDDDVDFADELVTIESRNCLPATLDEAQASQAVTDGVRRILFQRGVYRLHRPRLTVHREPIDLHMPYYLGFFGDNSALCVARLRVLDAVRRRFEGAKARELFHTWLVS
jgi:hypothetical protein